MLWFSQYRVHEGKKYCLGSFHPLSYRFTTLGLYVYEEIHVSIYLVIFTYSIYISIYLAVLMGNLRGSLSQELFRIFCPLTPRFLIIIFYDIFLFFSVANFDPSLFEVRQQKYEVNYGVLILPPNP